MPDTIHPLPSLLECVDRIKSEIHRLDGDHSTTVNMGNTDDALHRVQQFFGCNAEKAKILCIAIMEGFDNNAVSPDTIRQVLGLPLGSVKRIESFLRNLARIGLMKPKNRGRSSLSQNYEATPNLLDAVFHESRSLLKTRAIEHPADLVQKMYQIIEQYKSLRWHHAELFDEMKSLHKKHRKMPLVSWITGLHVSNPELCCLYYIIFKRLQGEMDIDLSDVDKAIIPHPKERFNFQREVLAGTLPMISKELITVESHLGGRMIELNLGPAVEAKLHEFELHIRTEKSEDTSILERIPHKQIYRKSLLFSASLSGQIEGMERLLTPARLPLVQAKLRQQGMNEGILALFHGVPGSGKTESVMQLAANTGRDIYRVNISGIRNKYVGESEKGVKAIFEQYRKLSTVSENLPILLFNEADAILGKRISVSTSVDQMNNAMQNILLEEMEKFQGIFVATTNLAVHLDDAFERRFTYKLKFTKAGDDVKKSLWLRYFPELIETEVVQLSESLDLSPAQIENLKKKCDIHQMIFEDAVIDAKTLRTLAEQEFMKTQDIKPIIGFRQP